MSTLELKLPPLLLVLVAALGMWLVSELLPGLAFPLPARTPLAFAIAGIGVGAALAGVAAFRRAHTTVNPTTPGASSSIVVSGIYRFSRNPMYLGFLLMLAGWALWLSNPVAALFLPLFVIYMNRFQIIPEERALNAKFGAQFSAYMNTVRRWL
jgi:protein-S-isoprenylcysteine O-methyltransferase Ste14